jgi:hypothetical protein
MKIRLVRTELFHADRGTDVKNIITFRSFANAPKSCCFQLSNVGCRSVLCSYSTFVRLRTLYMDIISSEIHVRFSEII